MKKIKPVSILFIGNSFSYYHALPKLIARFARASDSGSLSVDSAFKGGATLEMLWQDGKALEKLQSKAWDYVVLQERGRLGGIVRNGVVHVGRPRAFNTYAARFDAAAKKVGAKTILYCPPAFIGVGRPHEAKRLQAAYAALARKLHATMIPTGAAFMLALKKRLQMGLYERDRQHPSPLGAYLIASLFCRQLFHRRISDFPLESYSSKSAKIPKHPKRKRLSQADCQFLWSIANQK